MPFGSKIPSTYSHAGFSPPSTKRWMYSLTGISVVLLAIHLGYSSVIDFQFVMIRSLICLLLFAGFSSAQSTQPARGQKIPLWQNGAPGAENAPDVSAPSSDPALPKKFTVVHHPSIYVFLPPKEKANGLAVVVAGRRPFATGD